MLGRVETAGCEAGVKAPVAAKPGVDKSKRGEEVEERLCWGLGEGGCISGWEVAGCGGGVGGGWRKGNSCSWSKKWWKK